MHGLCDSIDQGPGCTDTACTLHAVNTACHFACRERAMRSSMLQPPTHLAVLWPLGEVREVKGQVVGLGQHI